MTAEVLVTTETELLIERDVSVLVETATVIELLEVAQQGPTGPPGVAGPPGLPGPPGLSGTSVSAYIAAVALSGHIAVVLDAAGQALPADAAAPPHYAVAGITTQAAAQGTPVEVINKGVLEHLGWTFTPDQPVFLGLAGAITQTLPPAAVFAKVLGIAVSPTRVSLDFQPAIFK